MNPDVNLARMTLLSICDELDIKGRFSNKFRVWSAGRPCDVLGFLMERLGYTEVDANGERHGPRDSRLARILGVTSVIIGGYYTEIDRPASTNESIRDLFKRTFEANPIRTTEHAPSW